MSSPSKTGLFFGSFNPIHCGHLMIASYMVEYTGLDQLWFVVTPHNPLKEKATLLADHHRLASYRRPFFPVVHSRNRKGHVFNRIMKKPPAKH